MAMVAIGNEGIEQHRVGRRGVLQGQVGEGVVAADAEQAEDEHRLPALFQQRPLAFEMGQGERQDEREGDHPAPEGQRQRRHVARMPRPTTMLPDQKRAVRVSSR
jgi:hypothetical protein